MEPPQSPDPRSAAEPTLGDGLPPPQRAQASPVAGPPGAQPWERDVLERLVMSTIEERRRSRRWSIFFRLVGLTLIAAVVWSVSGIRQAADRQATAGRHTALVELKGVIDAENDASADTVNSALKSAFEDANTAGVVLRINSPGGSPVQAGIIFDEIKRLRGKHPDTPLYAVVEEVCASGGYYVAAAADRIFVDKASLVGSIGVLMDGFGFTGTMDKLGVERRLFTAGRNKGFLDMFSPMSDEQRAYAQKMLDDIHQQFIGAVRKGRGDRLKEDPDLFSGLFWTGEKSIDLGLADEYGSVDTVARDVIKAESVVDFSTRENLAERLARRLGASAGAAASRALRAWVDAPRLH